MRVLGIDPGLRSTGWGLVDVQGSKLRHVANGQCQTPPGPLAGRLLALFEGLSEVIEHYAPSHAAVEQTFVNRDGAGTLKLGQARGMAMLVEHMVSLQLPGGKLLGPDATDALAIAICHAHHIQAGSHFQAALQRASG